VVLQVKPGEGTVGDFDGINGIASGTGNGVRGDAHSTGSGVLGTSDAAKGFAFGVSGSAVSPDGAGVSGRNDLGTAVTGFSTNGRAVNGVSVKNDGVVGTTSGAGQSGVSGTNNTVSLKSFSFGVFGFSSLGIGVAGRSDRFFAVHGVCVNTAFDATTAAVLGENQQNGTGVAGTSVNGPGVTGNSSSGTGGAFDGGEGTGVSGNSTTGTGVSGTSGTGTGGAFSTGKDTGVSGISSDGTGVSGTSSIGTGVSGRSDEGRGGVFASAKSAQLRLVPADNPTPGLPRTGQFGDVYVRLTGGEGTETIEMFLCVSPDGRLDLNDPAFWAPFQFGPVVRGG
jgi:hypothetical protein